MPTANGPTLLIGLSTSSPAPIVPTQYTFRYRVLKSSDLSDLGGLRGVLNEPVFGASINAGSKQLILDLDHYPSELTFGNVIRVNYPSGQVAGMWKHEQVATKLDGSNSYQIALQPLITEASDCDFNANYSADTTQPTAALGAATFDVPVTSGLALTQHLTGVNVNNNGTAYSYAFNNATVKQTLDQAVLFGGTKWWWFCDHIGKVSVANASPFTHVWTVGRDVVQGEWTEHINALTNIQPVVGGQLAHSTKALTATAIDTNGGNPYSVPNLGRRCAQPYNDSSLMDQSGVNAMATSLLAYGERVTRLMKCRVDRVGSTNSTAPGAADQPI